MLITNLNLISPLLKGLCSNPYFNFTIRDENNVFRGGPPDHEYELIFALNFISSDRG